MAKIPDPCFIPLVTQGERRKFCNLGIILASTFCLTTLLMAFLVIPIPHPWPFCALFLSLGGLVGLETLRRYRRFIDDILIFDQENLTLLRRTRVIVKIGWNDLQGYNLDEDGRTLRLFRSGQDPFVIHALRESGLPTLTTVVKIINELDKRMLPIARRERGLGKYGRIRDLHLIHGDRPPCPDLIPGTAYRYIDPVELERKALGIRKAEFGGLLLLAVVCFGTLPGSDASINTTIAAVTAILAWIIICFVAYWQLNGRWVRFRRTVRGTILAVEGGIKFSGDPRIYRRVLASGEEAETRTPSLAGVVFETYAAGKAEILVARRYLEPAEPPLTALSSHSANADLDLKEQPINHQPSNDQDSIMES